VALEQATPQDTQKRRKKDSRNQSHRSALRTVTGRHMGVKNDVEKNVGPGTGCPIGGGGVCPRYRPEPKDQGQVVVGKRTVGGWTKGDQGLRGVFTGGRITETRTPAQKIFGPRVNKGKVAGKWS